MMKDKPQLLVMRLKPEAIVPEYQTGGSAGMDLAYCGNTVTVEPGDRTLLSTGMAIAIPPGYEGQVRPRSGLAIKHGITLPNSPGTIDADYRGEVRVIIANIGAEPVTFQHGDRIAQLVIAPVTKVEITEAEQLPDTERGEGGFGSTGK